MIVGCFKDAYADCCDVTIYVHWNLEIVAMASGLQTA